MHKLGETDSKLSRKRPPATTKKSRENQMISLAVDLAEKQLQEGTASSQIVTHFLKLASVEKQIELEILLEQKKLIRAKTEAIQSSKKVEELYANALLAMSRYSGSSRSDQDD